MSATPTRKTRAMEERTAEPRSIDRDLAYRFIAGASAQSDFTTATDATPAQFVTSAPPHDESLGRPNFDPDATRWDQTVGLTLQPGELGAGSAPAESGERPGSGVESDDAASDARQSLFDLDSTHVLGAFDDDARWKEVARTGRAL